jgi:beta-galactosidase
VAEDLGQIREVGASAVRVSHYQHRQSTYDWLDLNGIVAWAEIPLLNMINNTAAFAENAKEQLRELIRQNYNHPSILFWGIFNELDDVPGANELATALDATVWEEDPTRVSVSASDLSDQDPLNWRTDVAGFNKYYGWYYGHAEDIGTWADNIHLANPKKFIAVSEYGAGGSPNQHEWPTWQPPHGGTFHPEEYLNEFHEASWNALKDKTYLWGKFLWSMFDFASDSRSEGDTLGRNDKGLVTYDRKTKKDAFYWYKANWTNEPFNYITSRRFTSRTSASTEVKIYSNLDNVTLKINGVSLGTKTGSDKVFKWNVRLSPGPNLIQVFSTRNGVTYTDSCSWNLTTDNSG